VTIQVRRFEQFCVFYLMFPCIFIACVAFYDWVWWLSFGVMAVLGLVVLGKAMAWLRFWGKIETLHLNVDGRWQLFNGHEPIAVELISMSRIPSMAYIFYFEVAGTRYPYVLFAFQVPADAQRMLTVYLKFLSTTPVTPKP